MSSLQLNFTDLINNGLSLDDLNEPHLTYDFPSSQFHANDSTYEETYTTEADTDQEMLFTSSSKKSQNLSQRTIHFSPDEDKLLVSAWLNVSMDPIKGFDQKKNQFWKRITQYFEDNKTWAGEQTEKSLTNRWSKISSQVSKFCGYYSAIDCLRKSGYTEQDKILEAKTNYKKEEGHTFVLEHCWGLMRFQQKWMDEHDRIETSRMSKAPVKNQASINLEDDDGDAPRPAPLKRPIGRKAAKEANKKAKFNEQGGENEDTSKIRFQLAEFRARRLENDRIKAEQLNLLIATEQKQADLREKEIELQAQRDKIEIMSKDTSKMPSHQAEYFIRLQKEILAKRASRNGSE